MIRFYVTVGRLKERSKVGTWYVSMQCMESLELAELYKKGMMDSGRYSMVGIFGWNEIEGFYADASSCRTTFHKLAATVKSEEEHSDFYRSLTFAVQSYIGRAACESVDTPITILEDTTRGN